MDWIIRSVCLITDTLNLSQGVYYYRTRTSEVDGSNPAPFTKKVNEEASMLPFYDIDKLPLED